jgi:hypothetical protein
MKCLIRDSRKSFRVLVEAPTNALNNFLALAVAGNCIDDGRFITSNYIPSFLKNDDLI